MSEIRFEATLRYIASRTLVRLPESASKNLPSRGVTLIKGTINNTLFQAVLEPDGKGSHWFNIDEKLSESVQALAGDTVVLDIEPSKDWPEPIVPSDLKDALSASKRAQDLWMEITPIARWDWIRWIRSTKNPDTRKRRIAVACDKLKKGERRPCCFNRNLCTDTEVSHKGVLLDGR